jgi:hypothetical protein
MRTRINLPRPFAVTFLLTACVLSGSGCGGSEKVVTVTGKVTHNDQPLAGIIVSFVPEAATKAGVSTGETDEDGKYMLTVFNTGQSGAVVGTHKVWVSLPRKPEDRRKPETAEEAKQKVKDARRRKRGTLPPGEMTEILKKYGKLDKTPLTVEVTGGQAVDLKLD